MRAKKNEPIYFPLCVAVLIFLPPFLIFSLSLRSCNSSFSAALLRSRLYLIVYNAFFGATFRCCLPSLILQTSLLFFCLLFYCCSLRLNLPFTCICFLAVHSFRCKRSKWWWQYNLCAFQALQARPMSMALSRCGAVTKNEPSYFPLCAAVSSIFPISMFFFFHFVVPLPSF